MGDIRIVICGDYVNTSAQILKLDAGIKTVIDCSDIAICNFEAPVKGDGLPVKKSGPCISQPVSSAQILLHNGFNAILLGNNHIMDYGDSGFINTKLALKHSTTEDSTPKCNYACKGMKKVCTGALNPSFFLGLAFILYCICFICWSV